MKTTLDDLKNRRSIRKYKPEQISDEELNSVLEVGTYAPTAKNTQNPLMVVVQEPGLVKKLSEMNAAVMGASHDPFYGAPTVVIVFAKSGDPNGVQDASLVAGNILNAAYAAGLGSCWINRAREMFDTPEGRELARSWGVPDDMVGVANCILGYAGEEPKAHPRKEGYIIRV